MMSFIDRIRSWFKSFSGKREMQRRERRLRDEKIRRAWEKRLEEERFLYRLGNTFEDYVADMFDSDKFELTHRTLTNEDTGGKFVKSMVLPDLGFREKSTGRRFWVECKFRSKTEDLGDIVWCTDNQLRNYKRTHYKYREPVFIMLGVRGTVLNPNKVYCLNLERINFTKLFYSTYSTNQVKTEKIDSLKQMFEISKLK